MRGEPTIDLDEYIAALPSRPLAPPRPSAPTRYQAVSYALLKPYNGFSGVERRRGGQLGNWLRAAGCVTLPSSCDICGGPGPLGQHSETYYHVGRDPALCRRCHRALHLRSWQWDAWLRIVKAATRTGQEWFVLAPRYGLDLAGHLRARWGHQAADIERSPITPLPESIASLLPGNMLAYPDL